MTHRELRAKFVSFFEAKGHKLVSSSSLLPKDDSSVLLTTAGMQQFKPYFVGTKDPIADFGVKDVVSIQKCFRTADIDKVGDDTHLTFFEMLGHFSFGGYFKSEAINYAWEFLTSSDWLGIDGTRIYATYYNGDRPDAPADTDSQAILEQLDGLSKIIGGGAKDNFWGPTGNEGPCGPNIEFYVDGVEVWNEVFNEYYRHADGLLTPLPAKGVDMGGGFERLLVAVNSLGNLFETDVLAPIMQRLTFLPAKSQRIVADHIRGVVFLLSDHILPSNKEEGYVLRRILRRVLLHLQSSGAILEDLIDVVIGIFQTIYPDLLQEQSFIKQIAREEADKFSRTIDVGAKELNKLIVGGATQLSGPEAFKLFASYGLPIDFIKEKIAVDETEFDAEFAKHQEISRAGLEGKFGGHGLSAGATVSDDDKQKITQLHTATHLLHTALRTILGKTVHQAGSDINLERARFDFAFPRKLTSEEISQIENWVNQKIQAGFVVEKATLPYQQAIDQGALAFFKEKYPAMVDVYTITDATGAVISRELCGGPHIQSSQELGRFKIVKEESSSAGVRRIKAVLE
ncbi:MAG: alanine--tRNA ligase [bacterium]